MEKSITFPKSQVESRRGRPCPHPICLQSLCISVSYSSCLEVTEDHRDIWRPKCQPYGWSKLDWTVWFIWYHCEGLWTPTPEREKSAHSAPGTDQNCRSPLQLYRTERKIRIVQTGWKEKREAQERLSRAGWVPLPKSPGRETHLLLGRAVARGSEPGDPGENSRGLWNWKGEKLLLYCHRPLSDLLTSSWNLAFPSVMKGSNKPDSYEQHMWPWQKLS